MVANDEPLLGMLLHINLEILTGLVLQVSEIAGSLSSDIWSSKLTVHRMDVPLAETGNRLLQAMLSEQDASVLGPSLIREAYYRVLNGSASGILRLISQARDRRSSVTRVLQEMHVNPSAPFNVETVARRVGMSASAFHEQFRAVTNSSPVRYLKTLRLRRARALMIHGDASVSEASERVGYVSQSQFSREFKRLFGRAPLEEARRIRTARV